MRFLPRLAFMLLTIASIHSAAQSTDLPQPLPADVRVLIDISGSMKKTDPQNLRKPAMELLVQLMPEGSQAGIWTFGQSVNMLVPHRPVDDDWIKTAASKSAGITSVALYTNIGEALEQSSYDREKLTGDREKLSERYRNNIILLTDGVVDISPDADSNQRERSRILNELLPALKSAGYIIHTIALSDAADQELMQALSLSTDGVFAVADTADELMTTFLRIFDQAVPAERLPLEGNKFLVDDSVKEFTVLTFRKADAAPTVLISPEGTSYTSTNAEDQVNWFSTDNYDLVTVQQPAPGEWQLKADIDPDNRVTVVSDLQLQVAPLINNLLVGQSLDLQFFFQEEKQRITSAEFLGLLTMHAQIKRHHDEQQWQIPLGKRHPPIDGVYQQSLATFDEAGEYTVRVVIDGKTFQREFKHHVSVISPFNVTLEKVIEDQRLHYLVNVAPDAQLVDIANTRIDANIKNAAGTSESQPLSINDQQQWQLRVTPTVESSYSIELTVSGKRNNGAEFKEVLPIQYFVYPQGDDPINPLSVAEDLPATPEPQQPEVVEEPEAETQDEPQPEPVVATDGVSKWVLYSGVVLANLLVFGLAFFAYRMIVSSKATEELDELEQTPDKPVSSNEKLAMQEVGQTPLGIDVSADDPAAHIPIDDTGTSNNDDVFLDLGDLEDNPGDTDKDK